MPTTPEGWLRFYADQYKVNADTMVAIAICESGLNPKAVGDNGHSRGLVQIHKPSHPTISDEQAFDTEFAAEFLAKNVRNNPYMWSCYKIIGKPPVI